MKTNKLYIKTTDNEERNFINCELKMSADNDFIIIKLKDPVKSIFFNKNHIKFFEI